MLPLTIQPFVENAIKHGLMEKKEGGTVWIRSRVEKSRIIVEIEDDGVGFDEKQLLDEENSNKAVGMKSAMYRIRYDMGGKCTVKSRMNKTGEGNSGTLIRIEIPVKRGGTLEDNHSR